MTSAPAGRSFEQEFGHRLVVHLTGRQFDLNQKTVADHPYMQLSCQSSATSTDTSCQSARKVDPVSASNFDPFARRARVPLQLEERQPNEIDANMVEERDESFLLPLPRHS